MSLDKFFRPEDRRKTDCDPIYTENPLYKKSHFLNLTREQILSLPKDKLDEYINNLRSYILNLYYDKKIPSGFASSSLKNIILRMKKFDNNNTSKVLVKEDHKFLLSNDKSGLVVNHWFPERYETKVSSSNKSLLSCIEDEKRWKNNFLRIVIKNKMYLWGYSSVKEEMEVDPAERNKENHINLFPKFNQGIRLGLGSQPIANFPPVVTKWIYVNEMKRWDDGDFYVMNPCLGWGSELISMISSTKFLKKNQKLHFIGTDPNSDISPHRYYMVKEFFNQNVRKIDHLLGDFVALCEPVEKIHLFNEYQKNKGMGNVAVTSPPYFNRELYGNETMEQSHAKYKEYDSWKDGFLAPMLWNVYDYLRPGGRFYLNIADIKLSAKKNLPLATDSINIGNEIGFKHIDTFYMVLTTSIGNNKNKRPDHFKNQLNMIQYKGDWKKTEPILILEK